ncbi:MAG: DUF1553 domain-containing protein [Verrucomicrobiales bacterium]|nr:DUF1553 domain-containing protein [Verrucomicrobiales bacterium]
MRESLPVILIIGFASQVFGTTPDFDSEVAPILESRCLSCHNEHEKKGGLDLSRSVAALENVISPGAPDSSKLLAVISGPEPEMPKIGNPLQAEQVATLRSWIAAGAKWPEGRILVDNPERDLDWWSLKPIATRQGLVADSTGSGPSLNPVERSTVDVLIDEKLKEKKLTPNTEATEITLLRRITYDLTGLPPTPEEISAFQLNPDWEKTVDRLLASPAFGEKFARHWLDLARYAETHGYDKDKPRNNAWPYRDYVIKSFNEDKAFPRFVQEQVAGDALYPGEPDAITALGFLAAGPWDHIGHWEVGEAKLDGRIAKHLDRDEMISAVFNVFQSTTVQCAQCHHHKFDPIRMEDYYRLHAVFAAVDRADRVYDGLPPEQQKQKNELLSQITKKKKEQEELTTGINRLVAAKTSGLDRRIAALKDKYGTGSEQKPQFGYHSNIANHQNEEKWVQVDLGKPRSATRINLIPAYDNYAGIGAGFGFPVRFRIEVSNDASFQRDVRTLLDATKKDHANPKSHTVFCEGDGRPFRFVRVTATKLAERKNDFIFALAELEVWPEQLDRNFAAAATVTARDSIEQGTRWGKKNLVDGIYFKEITNPEAAKELETLEREREAIANSLRPPDADQRLSQLAEELKQLEEAHKAIPEGKLVYAAATHFPRRGRFTATAGKPRPIHLLHRGDLRSPGDTMRPGAPPLWPGVQAEFFSQQGWNESEARAHLAQYLTRKDNPLLWRSIANRVWQWTMGAPLVGTPNDFGRGGMEPTHPELLDYLASSLRDDPKHSLKSIVRLIVLSDAYRRSSDGRESNAAIDGNNTYLWRANRRRLTAEEYRDSLLDISGILDRSMGDPGFQDFVIEKPQHSPHYQYHLHDPNDPESHRRTIYRFVVRSQPQPMLTTLDCADPSLSVPERDESTTALQALTQWNHRFVEAMSGQFAARLRNAQLDSPQAKVGWACELALGRPPSKEEESLLTKHLSSHGEESFARVLFNLNAFVYVD